MYTQRGFCSRVPFCCGAFVRKTKVVDMDVHDDHANRGAARRRRERRLRVAAPREALSLSRCSWPLCLTNRGTELVVPMPARKL